MAIENEPRDPDEKPNPVNKDEEEVVDPMEETFVDDDLDEVSEADDRINSAEGPV